jgi:hypothetical protein
MCIAMLPAQEFSKTSSSYLLPRSASKRRARFFLPRGCTSHVCIGSRLCKNSEDKFSRGTFVSNTLNRKRTALAGAAERRKGRIQFCSPATRARFHTAWVKSGKPLTEHMFSAHLPTADIAHCGWPFRCHAVFGPQRYGHWHGWRIIPVGLNVRRGRFRRKFQPDFDFGIVRSQTHSTAHAQSYEKS